MSRLTEFEVKYDEHTLLVGEVSLDAENRVEFESFSIIVWIGGIDYDVTKAFESKRLEYFKRFFEAEVRPRMIEDKGPYFDWDEPA